MGAVRDETNADGEASEVCRKLKYIYNIYNLHTTHNLGMGWCLVSSIPNLICVHLIGVRHTIGGKV